MKWLALICGFFSLLVCSCSNSVGVQAEKKPPVDVSSDTLAGMQRVQTLKSVTVLGTLESKAKVNERPKMKVRFDYDFSMGRHEVTCGEFNAVMENVSGLVLDCENDSLPATNLTFYDAVLFANARSKKEGFDTAYTYTSAVFDTEKHCTALDGFAY